MEPKQTSWIYRSLAPVTPRQVGWVFCGMALLTIILLLLSIYGNDTNNTYSTPGVIMFIFTLLAGVFGVISWLIDKFIKDEERRIRDRYALHFALFIGLFMLGLTILRSLHSLK